MNIFFKIIVVCLLIIAPAFAQDTEDYVPVKTIYDMSLEELMDVSIYVATRSQVPMEKAPSIVSVITAKEIKNMGARNIIDVFKTVPGFDLANYIVTNNHDPIIRGIRSIEKLKIMINGHTLIADDFSGGTTFDNLPLACIKKIEIIRGPGSALYGNGAFIGVVNIITKEGGDEPSNISIATGSNSTFKYEGEFSFEKDDLKLYLYGEHFDTDGNDETVESDMATNSAVIPGTSLPMFATAAPEPLTSESEHYAVGANINFKNAYSSILLSKMKDNVPIGATKVLTDENKREVTSSFAEIGYRHPLADKGGVLVKTYYDYFKMDDIYELFPEETAQLHNGYAAVFPADPYGYGWSFGDPFPAGEGVVGSPRGKKDIRGCEITADYEVLSGIQTVGGLLYEKQRMFDVEHHMNHNGTGSPLLVNNVIYSPFPFTYFPGGLTDISENGNWLSNPRPQRDISAIYFQGTFDLKELFSLEDGLSVTAGIRYDDYDDVGSSTNPRLGMVWIPREDLYFKLLYGEAFRAPNFSELYIDSNPVQEGNIDVRPEEITTIEWLVGYDFNSNIRSSVTLFHIKAEDLLRYGFPDTNTNLSVKENTGEITGKGAELEVKYMFDKQKYGYINLTFQKMEDTTHDAIRDLTGADAGQGKQSDFTPGNIPEIYGNIGINYDIFEYMIAGLSINYVGKRERSEEKVYNGSALVKADQRSSIKAHTMVNVSFTFINIEKRVGWMDWAKGIEIQLSGYNVFDDEYDEPDSEALLEKDYPVEAVTYMAKISYVF